MNINYDAHLFVPYYVVKVPAFLDSASECAFLFSVFLVFHSLEYTSGHVLEYDAL
jgi:hypothetical protein